MKLGAENRTKLIAAVALMVLAGILVARWMFSSGGSSPTGANPSASVATPSNAPPAPRTRRRGRKIDTASRSLDPSLRYDWLKASEDTKYQGKGRNIFQEQIDIPRPVKPPVIPTAPQPFVPPPPPPINLKFFGFASKPGEPKKIFLSQGEDVFIAGEGEMVDRRYKILRISPMSVEVEDVLNNNRQSIPLTQG